jgi:uncharacterized membrane protein YgaE (UPF0421/DUF939 family)
MTMNLLEFKLSDFDVIIWSMTEMIQNPSPERHSTAEEAAQIIDESVELIANDSKNRSLELKDEYGLGSRNEVKRQIKLLRKRMGVITGSLDELTDVSKLGKLTEYLEIYTEVMTDSITVADNNEILAGMINRYGDGVRVYMQTNGLLSDETREKLDSLMVHSSEASDQ